MAALLELLMSDSKKFHPRKWWSLSVVRMLLSSHLNHLKAFSNTKQDAPWFEKQKIITKSKFELDQKNREDKLAQKQAVEKMRGWRPQRIEKQWLNLQINLSLALRQWQKEN